MQIYGDAVRFGLHSGQQVSDFGASLDLWLRAEDLGYDWVSIFDHLRPPLHGPNGPCLEGTTLLAALAARTSRVRCAILVSAVTWRHPALAANIAATIDHVSGGRLEFGMGAAGPDLAYEQYGIPFPGIAVRMEMLDEACQIMRSLWTDPVTNFRGRHFTITEAYLNPKPLQRRIPIVIGCAGDQMLRLVARHADIWNTLVCDPKEYQRKLDVLAAHCADIGRNPAEIRKSITFRAVLAEDANGVRRRKSELLARVAPSDLREYLTYGTPEECVADLRVFADLGVRDFIVGARQPVDWQSVELVARHAAPVVRERPRAQVQ